jgi:hypothetical protein
LDTNAFVPLPHSVPLSMAPAPASAPSCLRLALALWLLSALFLAAQAQSVDELRKKSLREADVILHIGPPKTATSHIQYALHRLRKEVSDAGYCWPIEETPHIHAVGLAFQDGKPGPNQYVKLLKGCLDEGKKLIFSTEKLSQVFEPQGFHQIHKLFKGYKIHVVAMYRESLTVLYSYYNQLARNTLHFQPFTNYLIRNYHKYFSQLMHTSLHHYSREFGRTNMTIIDFNGAVAAKQDMAKVFLCDLLGILCDAPMIADEGSHPSVSLLPHHLFSLARQAAQTLRCDMNITEAGLADTVRRYTKGVDFSTLPVIESKYELVAQMSKRLDAEVRRDFGEIMVYYNQSAAMAALSKFSAKEIYERDFYADDKWVKWLWNEVDQLKKLNVARGCKLSVR